MPGAAVSRPLWAAQAAVVLLLADKLYLTFAAPPIGDEAYYWMWGQKLDWSYFDHPPMHAWLLRAASLFGWNHFALRVLTWLTLSGTLWIFWLWARRLRPEDPAAWWWPSAAIYLASPLFFLMGSVAFHDHLLIFLTVLAAHCFLMLAERRGSGDSGTAWLYAGAVAIGLAVLTKYNGVLLALGVAVFFAVHRPLYPLWRSPHLYLAAGLSILMQAPVLWWNASRGFASYTFHLSERWDGELFRFRPLGLVEFLALAVVFISPFIIPAIVGVIQRKLGAGFADTLRTLALSVFAVSSIAMLLLSAFVEVFFYWNIVAFLLLMPLLTGWMKRRWVMHLHFVYGTLFALGCLVNFTIAPLGNLIGRYDWTISSTFGWPEVAARIDLLRAQHDIGFVAVSRYTTAAQLGFALRDPDVTTLAERHDQYDYWFDPKLHAGQTALLVADPHYGVGYMASFFDGVTPLETVPISRYGRTIYEPTIYLGTGFHPRSGD
jgi:4-amino-4-deoxy-L-arabinose transferase-like glycosyltransferase